MTENPINPQNMEEEEGFNLYEIVFKYLIYWPWFIVSVLVCLIGAYVYLKYQTPVPEPNRSSVGSPVQGSRWRQIAAATGSDAAEPRMRG